MSGLLLAGITKVLLLSACLGQNVSTSKVRKILGDTEIENLPFLEKEARPPLIKSSPRIKRYGISNETLVIPGKMRNVITKDVTTRTSENDDKPRILLEKINASDNLKWRLKASTEIRESHLTDLGRRQHQSEQPEGPAETYKVSESLQGRPTFHIAPDIPLRREARLNIENDQLEFPTFATQFFGSFGEFSQSFDETASSHNDDRHYDPFTNNYHQKPHSDPRPHHHTPHSQHLGFNPHAEKPRPLKPPKREILSAYHEKPVVSDQHNSIKDVSALYVEDPWKHIDKVVDSPPPYVPKPLHQEVYDHGGFDVHNDIHQPRPVYSPPEPIVYEPARPEYEPVHVEEYVPQVQPVYHPPQPKPVFHYSKPNYRPPIKPKPIKDKHHSIVNVPHIEPEVHYDAPHHPDVHYDAPHHQEVHYDEPHHQEVHYDEPYHPEVHYDEPHRPEFHYDVPHHPEVHTIDGEHHPSEYLHPVQHMKDEKGELDFYKKYANRIHGSKALSFKGPQKFRLPGTRAGGARFLHLPGGPPGSTFSSDEIQFGGETGGLGAFRWFSDHPALGFSY